MCGGIVELLAVSGPGGPGAVLIQMRGRTSSADWSGARPLLKVLPLRGRCAGRIARMLGGATEAAAAGEGHGEGKNDSWRRQVRF